VSELMCEDVRELAAELAVDALDGDQRAAALTHLDRCTGCRHVIADLAVAADGLLAVLPARDVPPELTARLHAAVPPSVAPVAPAAPARPARRHAVLAACAAVAIVVAAVVGLTIRSAHAPGGGRGEFALVTPEGDDVGNVVIRDRRERPWIWMYVHGAEASQTLTCVVVLDDGSAETVGLLSTADGKGDWGGPLGLAPERIRSARLLDGDGEVVATADIE
jgi:anti-sigma-K factor RskA